MSVTSSTTTTTSPQAAIQPFTQTPAAPQFGLASLPPDVLINILRMLSIQQFGALNQTCRQFCFITRNHPLTLLLSQHFPNFQKTDPNQTELEALKEQHRINSNLTKGVYASHTLQGHNNSVFSLALDGQRLFSGSDDNTIKIWDLNTNTCTATLQGHNGSVESLALDGQRLISGSYKGAIEIWDLNTNTCTATLLGHNGNVRSLALDGQRLFSCSEDTTIKIWDLNTNTCTATLEEHDGPVLNLALDGQRLFSGSYDKTVKIWDFKAPDDAVFNEIADLLKCEHSLIAEDAMARFNRMPPIAKNAIYGELYQIIAPFANDTPGCAEHAFHNQNGQRSTPEQRAQAILNFLAKRPGPIPDSQ